MKRHGVLNRHLSGLISSLGHMEEIVVADAGLPAPRGVQVIDLAVSRGVPGFWQVLDALRSELVIESALCASQAPAELRGQMAHYLDSWGREFGQSVKLETMTHADFKDVTERARAIIRTGECRPYCNLSLVSGVWF